MAHRAGWAEPGSNPAPSSHKSARVGSSGAEAMWGVEPWRLEQGVHAVHCTSAGLCSQGPRWSGLCNAVALVGWQPVRAGSFGQARALVLMLAEE